MLHHVKIAMGGTRVLKYRCFFLGGGGIHSCGWHARFKVRLLAFDIQYVHACNQLVVEVSVYCIQHICRKYTISRVGRLQCIYRQCDILLILIF